MVITAQPYSLLVLADDDDDDEPSTFQFDDLVHVQYKKKISKDEL
jgi:hypothetical protein